MEYFAVEYFPCGIFSVLNILHLNIFRLNIFRMEYFFNIFRAEYYQGSCFQCGIFSGHLSNTTRVDTNTVFFLNIYPWTAGQLCHLPEAGVQVLEEEGDGEAGGDVEQPLRRCQHPQQLPRG